MIHLALEVAAFLFLLACGIVLLVFCGLLMFALISVFRARLRNRGHK
jgi:hypothetical protein